MIQNPLTITIKLLLNINIYNKYRSFISNNEIHKELLYLYTSLDELILKYNRDISFDEYSFYCLSNSNDKESIECILNTIASQEVNEDLILELLDKYKERTFAHKIALQAIEVTEGRSDFTSLIESIKDVDISTVSKESFIFVSNDLEELYDKQVKKHGLRWRLNTLNRMLGSIRRGDFGFVFARPETGKTTFIASEVTYFAEQIGEDEGPIIWFNNEEDGAKVQLRCYQASLGLPLENLYANRAENQETYKQLVGEKLKIYDSASITKLQVERICKELQPSCIIFDQLDKIKGFDGDREDLRLGSIYQWARELAKTYAPVIGISQADGSGEGKKWLTMENVANAKTAKQAEADWILGIGATHNEGFEFVRHLHLSKNKLTGDEDTDSTLRHGKIDCIIEPMIARYRDYI